MSGTTLTPEQATACQRLAEAEQALHTLSLGGALRAITDENGERVEYTSANRVSLIAYINMLRPLCPLATQTYNPPTRFLF